MVFKIGDQVAWTSQYSGSKKDRVGVVLMKIKADSDVRAVAISGYGSLNNPGMPRNHDSYIVGVRLEGSASRGDLYWPRVAALRKVLSVLDFESIARDIHGKLEVVHSTDVHRASVSEIVEILRCAVDLGSVAVTVSGS